MVDAEEPQRGVVELGEHLVGEELIRAEVGPPRVFRSAAPCCSRSGIGIVMVADDLDDPALAAGRVRHVVGMHQLLEVRVEQVEPLGVQIVAPDRLDRVDVDPELLERVLVFGLVGVELVVA